MYFDPVAGSDQALLITEQLLVFATVVGSVGALPSFIEFMTERRKRKERIDLSLEDEAVESLRPRLAGMDELLGSIEDLVDRARHPEVYEDLKIGNEVLIIGPHQSGKKSLAQTLAKLTGMERLVTVYNPRDSDALAQAKSLVRGYKWQKVMLLLPRIDLAYKESDAEVLETDRREIPEDAQRMFSSVAQFYLKEARRRGFRLEGITDQEFCARVLYEAMNPAEIEDIVVLCETTALYRRRTRKVDELVITPEILETAIHRVIVG